MGIYALQNDGELVTEVIPKDHHSRNRALADTVVENIAKGTEIHTDEHNAYKRLGKSTKPFNTVRKNGQRMRLTVAL